MLHQKANPFKFCELKFDKSEKDEYKFSGYLTVYGSNDKVNDTIHKGALSEAVGKSYPIFVNHQHYDIPVGSFTGKEDDKGFFIEAEINKDHHLAKSAYTALKRGDIKGLSQGFTMQDGWFEEKAEGGCDIYKLDLMEGSIVTFPCEGKAEITAVKSAIENMNTIKDCESYLRDACGLSRSMAKAFVGQLKSCAARDAQSEESEINKGVLDTINQLRSRL